MSKSALGKASSDSDPSDKELTECPTCGRDDFASPFGIKKHHKMAHGESLMISLTCEVCGCEYKRYPSDVKKGRVCSLECAGEIVSQEMSGENHYNWAGGSDGYYGPNWKRQRRKARNRDDHTCQDCGTHTSELDKRIQVHHITPIRDYELESAEIDYEQANRLDNLICLCMSCHNKWEGLYLRPDTRGES